MNNKESGKNKNMIMMMNTEQNNQNIKNKYNNQDEYRTKQLEEKYTIMIMNTKIKNYFYNSY